MEDGTVPTWSARSVRPITAVHVSLVFVVFGLLAHFVFHSPEAVKALAAAAVGAVASLAPSILGRVEYRVTDVGLGKRTRSAQRPRAFKDVFLWDELSHLVQTRSGFKYVKKLDEPSPVARFLKLHVLGDHSGELHVERDEMEGVRALLGARGARVLGGPGSAGSAVESRPDA